MNLKADGGAGAERIPLAFNEEGSDALASVGLRVDVALGAGVETAGHVDLEGVGLARLDLPLWLEKKHTEGFSRVDTRSESD